jgi:hypothetical protein
MKEKVKLRSSIILGGIVHTRDKIIDRKLVEGTRFDSEEFLITSDEPEFSEPAWDDKVEVSNEVNEEITGGPDEDEIVRIPGVKRLERSKKKFVRR